MTLGTHLTILDYLGTNKGTYVFESNQSLLKNVNFPSENNFRNILSTCRSEQNKSRLTALDYLANPVRVKSNSNFENPEQMLRGKLGRAEIPVRRAQESATTEYARKQAEQKSEKESIKEDIERSIEKASKKYNLSYDLIKGVIKAESDFQVMAESSAGARGLMQLMPATAEELGVKDSFDIDQNIDAGSRYLRNMMDRFGGDPKMALSAYNAGPGTVEKYNGNVPYQETRRYVAKVLDYAGLAV